MIELIKFMHTIKKIEGYIFVAYSLSVNILESWIVCNTRKFYFLYLCIYPLKYLGLHRYMNIWVQNIFCIIVTIFTTWTLWSSFQKRDSWSLHNSKKWKSSWRSTPEPDLTAPFSSKWFSSHCNLAVGFPTGGDDVFALDSLLELFNINSKLCGICIWHVYPSDFSCVFVSIRCHSSSFELLILPTDSLSVCSLSPSKKSFSLLERGSDRGSNAIGFVLAGIIRKNPFSLPFSSNFYLWH